MRIVIASPYLPWPLTEGGRAAQYRTFEALRDDCAFTLVVPVYTREGLADARGFSESFPNVRVEAVRCGDIAPARSRYAIVRRAAGKLLKRVFPPTPRAEHSLQKAAEAVPSYPFSPLYPEFVTAVQEQLAKGCDIFQAEFAGMLTLGPLMTGRVPSIFVHHQLTFIYARRFLEASEGGSANAQYITQRMICEEAAYLNTFDSAIVFSEVDREALQDFCPALEVSVSPFPCPEEPPSAAVPFEKPARRFVFVASERHHPNYDGLQWFMREVWPGIKRILPGASMEVIGKWSHHGQTSLPNWKEICFSGFVPDLLKSLQHKIMIVPVWVGSGIRTKILAAWSASCPVVTTTIGVEGLPGRSGDHFIVADHAPAFATACIELSQNISEMNRIAGNGLDLVQKHYSLAAVRKTRLEVYERLLAGQRRPKS
jgi:hypothetical protein